MSNGMRLNNTELSLMSLFESLTDVFPMACRVSGDNVFFVVDKKDYFKLVVNSMKMLGIRHNGISTRRVIANLAQELSGYIGKRVHISFYDGVLENFIRSFFNLSRGDVVQVKNLKDGSRFVVIVVSPSKRGIIIGRNGVRARIGRELAKNLFNVKSILIK